MLTIVSILILGIVAWLIFDACMALLFLLLANILMRWHRRKRRTDDYSLTD